MLPFVCSSARNIRNFSSTLKFSAKVARRSLSARARGKSARTVCVTELADGKWMNHRIEDALNKNGTMMFTTTQNNLTSICSLMGFLALDSTNVVGVEGDDDEVTCSAGNKRKHWKTWADEG